MSVLSFYTHMCRLGCSLPSGLTSKLTKNVLEYKCYEYGAILLVMEMVLAGLLLLVVLEVILGFLKVVCIRYVGEHWMT